MPSSHGGLAALPQLQADRGLAVALARTADRSRCRHSLLERPSSLVRSIQPHFTSAICQLGGSDWRFVAQCTTCGTVVPTLGLKERQGAGATLASGNDVLVPHPRYAEAVRRALREAPDYHVVANAGHYDLLAPCSDALASIAPAICASSAGFDRAGFHVGFDSEVVNFFEKTLEGLKV
jgi:hypothetical protein